MHDLRTIWLQKNVIMKKAAHSLSHTYFFEELLFRLYASRHSHDFLRHVPLILEFFLFIQTYAQSKQMWCQDAICKYINYCIHLHTLDLRCSYKIIPYGSKHALKLKHLYITPISSIKILRYRFDTLRKSNQIKKKN